MKNTYAVLDCFFALPMLEMVAAVAVASHHNPMILETIRLMPENHACNFPTPELPLDMMTNSHNIQPFGKYHSRNAVNYLATVPNIGLAIPIVYHVRLMHFAHGDSNFPAISSRMN